MCVYMSYRPFRDNDTDILSQLCQMQIFLCLVSAVVLNAAAASGQRVSPVLEIALIVMAIIPLAFTIMTTFCQGLLRPCMSSSGKAVRNRTNQEHPKGPTGEAEASVGLLTPPMLRAQLDEAVRLKITDTDAILLMLKNIRSGKFDFEYAHKFPHAHPRLAHLTLASTAHGPPDRAILLHLPWRLAAWCAAQKNSLKVCMWSMGGIVSPTTVWWGGLATSDIMGGSGHGCSG